MNVRYRRARNAIMEKRLADSPFTDRVCYDFFHDIQQDAAMFLYSTKSIETLCNLERAFKYTFRKWSDQIEGDTEIIAGYKIRIRFSRIHDIIWHTFTITLGE